MSTTVTGGNVTGEDRAFLTANKDTDVAFGDGVTVECRLTMAADITSSDADIIRNETAVWEYAAGEPAGEPTRATSPAPSSALGPGFSVVTAVTAFLIVAVLVRQQPGRRRQGCS